MTRNEMIESSNNTENGNKNLCALAITSYLGTQNNTKYLHTIGDILKSTRKNYKVKSTRSTLKGLTVGSIRKQAKTLNCKYLIVIVNKHVILLNTTGETVVDTDSRIRDARKIEHVYIVNYKG